MSNLAVRDILAVHLPEPSLIADVTWGIGNFWLTELLERHEVIGSDLRDTGDIVADCRRLPYRGGWFDAVCLDPPWGNISTRPRGGGMEDRFQLQPQSLDDLLALYRDGIAEGARVLRAGGIMIVKCQDFVFSNKKRWLSLWVPIYGNRAGLRPLDQRVQISPGKPNLMWHQKGQKHLRSRHTVFWALRKDKQC
jgi:hypothetical protein